MKSIPASWVIPAFNEIVEIEECLDSILSQKRLCDEVIFVDDNSNDGTYEFLMKNVKHLRVFRNKARCGPGVGRNKGTQVARNDLIFMGDVAWYHKDRTVRTEQEFLEDPGLEVSFSYGIVRRRGESVEETFRKRHSTNAEVNHGSQGSMVWDFKKPCFTPIGPCHIPLPGVAGKKSVWENHPFSEFSPHHEEYQRVFYDVIRCGHKYKYMDKYTVLWTRGTSHRDKAIGNRIKDDMYARLGVKTGYATV